MTLDNTTWVEDAKTDFQTVTYDDVKYGVYPLSEVQEKLQVGEYYISVLLFGQLYVCPLAISFELAKTIAGLPVEQTQGYKGGVSIYTLYQTSAAFLAVEASPIGVASQLENHNRKKGYYFHYHSVILMDQYGKEEIRGPHIFYTYPI